ncbi:MAG TPA: DMT family transporter [Saprospiraceae bacterium]|nr:DMT family transporter [Saprospiraceae bacterium]
MQYIYLLLALLAGTMMPTQAAINNKLAMQVQSPVLSSFISFGVGLAALFIYILISGIPLGNLSLAKNAHPVAWLGGLCGAFFVTAVVIVVPRLGVALTFSIIIMGQMLATLPIDHFGFLGTVVKQINVPRILGVILIIIGVLIVRRF